VEINQPALSIVKVYSPDIFPIEIKAIEVFVVRVLVTEALLKLVEDGQVLLF
jgi:hypothetical protein